jgi:hypothetical protein
MYVSTLLARYLKLSISMLMKCIIILDLKIIRYIAWEFLIPKWFLLDYQDLFEIDANPNDDLLDDWNKT